MITIDKHTFRAIKKACRQRAHEMMLKDYKLYDDIWWHRIRISPELYKHGRGVVAEINQSMPNLLSKSPFVDTLDCVAEHFGFETTSALVDYLLAYRPRKPVEERYFNLLMDQELGEGWDDPAPPESQSGIGIDEVPF